jgi:hypothetical protein
LWMVDDDQFLRRSMTTSSSAGIRDCSAGITKHAPHVGSPPAERTQ